MPPELHFDLATLDFHQIVADKEAIGKVNPQRFEMEQLDAVVFVDSVNKIIVGYKVYANQARDPHDADLILSITYANMAALDNLAERSDAITEKVEGNLDKQNQGFAERGSMREILGSKYIRELILK